MEQLREDAPDVPVLAAGNGKTNKPELGNDANANGDFTTIEKALFGCSKMEFAAKLSADLRLERAWRIVESGYANPELRLSVARKEAGASSSSLNEHLKEACGLTFYQVVIRYRILAAAISLVTRRGKVLDVALDAGFGSIESLERNFKKLLGVPPSRMRKKQSGGSTPRL